MKRVIIFAVCAAFIAVCFSGCVAVNFSDFNAVAGKGDLEKYEFRVGGYSGIKANGLYEIRYYAASSNTVTLEVQPNLREYFIVEVISGDLVVRTTRRISPNSGKTPVLTVSAPVLNRVSIEGVGTFTAYNKMTADSFALNISGAGSGKAELDVKSLFVDLSGTGSFELSGRADSADLTMSGAGELKALSLQTQTANVNLSGVGTVSIYCAGNLFIDAGGMGAVEYKGSPVVNINKGGMVSIRKLD